MEKFFKAIDDLENINGLVISKVKYEDGTEIEIEQIDLYGYENISKIYVVDLREYEDNGYDLDGIKGTWIGYEL